METSLFSSGSSVPTSSRVSTTPAAVRKRSSPGSIGFVPSSGDLPSSTPSPSSAPPLSSVTAPGPPPVNPHPPPQVPSFFGLSSQSALSVAQHSFAAKWEREREVLRLLEEKQTLQEALRIIERRLRIIETGNSEIIAFVRSWERAFGEKEKKQEQKASEEAGAGTESSAKKTRTLSPPSASKASVSKKNAKRREKEKARKKRIETSLSRLGGEQEPRTVSASAAAALLDPTSLLPHSSFVPPLSSVSFGLPAPVASLPPPSSSSVPPSVAQPSSAQASGPSVSEKKTDERPPSSSSSEIPSKLVDQLYSTPRK